ncbi:filamentous hemagglutinin N-terminal domain-containing protein [Pusillimonas sp. DMV24BSW_D]|uniref:MBG domain-containing protein n=1 Tax=Neopusillimonas aestuarii TaxID=2716226 RepID=UPI00140E2B31|nr:MBG domain-containing protein [Pusillimonas sp. DMV24BSW_D]QIM47684.1 filamentous hemagglutinin N-terminal domain-containing protein [Pusillimonas sp. DMV24BSW_D]
MNHVYSLVYNDHTQSYVPAPENVSRTGKRNYGWHLKASGLLMALVAAMASPALGQTVASDMLPSGGQVVGGQASISQNAGHMQINQQTDRAIINWQSMNIGTNAAVNFNQPGASSVALNRVVAGGATEIHGQLTANGQVWLVNPNGVMFGAGSVVNVGGLVASTMDITNQDFMEGKGLFNRNGGTGSVTNKGQITAADGGTVALLAPTVVNDGIIKASMGNVVMAAGDRVTLDVGANGMLKVAVDPATVNTLVENRQLILADGGQAIMTGRAANEMVASVVSNSGTVQARTLAEKDGRILLLADMKHGQVHASGSLEASFVETSAATVNISADLAVNTHGGEWLIDPIDITIDENKAMAIQGALYNGDVTVSTADGASNSSWGEPDNGVGTDPGNIYVNASIEWIINTLTLRADNNISLNAELDVLGNGGLALEFGQGAVAAGNTAGYTVNAPVNFEADATFSTKLGSDGGTVNYTVITELGNEGSLNDGSLQGMAGDLAGNYVLGADIDASSTATWNADGSGGYYGFAPIGDRDTRFTGQLHGMGHSISNLTIKRRTSDYSGLIGYADPEVTIRDIGVSNAVLEGQTSSGILVGGLEGTVMNAWASGTVDTGGGSGGLVGSSSGAILDSWSSANVTAHEGWSGTSGYWNDVGGLVGANGGEIKRSYATGNVVGNFAIGGLVGNSNANGRIEDSYATGQVQGTTYAIGGLIGRNYGGGQVNRSYATGYINGTGSGLIGVNESPDAYVTNSFWDVQTSGKSSSDGGIGKTTVEMQNPFTFISSGWDFSSTWAKSNSNENGGYMMLAGIQSASFYDGYLGVAGDLSREYGAGSNPSLDGVITTAGTVGAVDWGSAITTTSNVGTYLWSAANVLSVPGGNIYTYLADDSGLTITPKVLTITGTTAAGKVYDGTTTATITPGSLSGFVDDQTVQIASVGGVFDSKNVGERVATATYTLADGTNGGLASNYTLAQTTGHSATITPAALTVAAKSDLTKVYGDIYTFDGTDLTITGLQNSETIGSADITSAGAVATASVNGGAPYSVAVSNAAGGTFDANNYTITYESGALEVTPAALTVAAKADLSKTYGDTYNLSADDLIISGLKNSESIGLVDLSSAGTVATAAVNGGTPYVVDVSNARGGTFDAANYDITYDDGALAVTPASLTVAGKSGLTKTYGDTYTFSANDLIVTGLKNSETIGTADISSAGAAATAAVNGGSAYTVVVSNAGGGSFNSSNYSITYENGALTVTPASLTIAGKSDLTKTYGDTYAFSAGDLVITGLKNSETIGTADISSTGAAATAAVNGGSSYDVAVSNASGGTFDVANYAITYEDGALTVTPAALTVTGKSDLTKTYGDTYTFSFDDVNVTGLKNDESIGLADLSSDGAVATAAVNSGTPYSVDISNARGGTFDAANYTITYNDGALTVTPAALTVAGKSDLTKVYGDTYTFGADDLLITGLKNNDGIDSVDISSDGSVATASALGRPYSVNVSNASGSAFDTGNYNITYQEGELTVTPAALTVAAKRDLSKTYGETYVFDSGDVTITGLKNSETIGSVDISSAGATATAAVNGGTPYAVLATNASGGTFNADNYTITYEDGSLTITPKTLTISGTTADNKTYDGTAVATINPGTLSGFVGSETVQVASATGLFDSKNVGTRTATATYTLADGAGGGLASNYTLAQTAGHEATITPAALTVTANDATTTFSGAPWSGGNGVTYSGFVANENAAVLTGELAYGGNSQGAVDVGDYLITPSGLVGQNYFISFVDGSLRIKPATPSPAPQTDAPSSGELVTNEQQILDQPGTPPTLIPQNANSSEPGGAGIPFLSMAPGFIPIESDTTNSAGNTGNED